MTQSGQIRFWWRLTWRPWLDIPEVSHVLNFDLPETPDEYTHRIGALAGPAGTARRLALGEWDLERSGHQAAHRRCPGASAIAL
jgi:hypothetical protein